MKTIIENAEFKIQFNGSKTYFLNNKLGDCIKYFDSEKKAINYFNKLSKQAGL